MLLVRSTCWRIGRGGAPTIGGAVPDDQGSGGGGPAVAAFETEREQRRLANYGLAAQVLAEKGGVRPRLDSEETAATIWSIGHPLVPACVVEGGWSRSAITRGWRPLFGVLCWTSDRCWVLGWSIPIEEGGETAVPSEAAAISPTPLCLVSHRPARCRA